MFPSPRDSNRLKVRISKSGNLKNQDQKSAAMSKKKSSWKSWIHKKKLTYETCFHHNPSLWSFITILHYNPFCTSHSQPSLRDCLDSEWNCPDTKWHNKSALSTTRVRTRLDPQNLRWKCKRCRLAVHPLRKSKVSRDKRQWYWIEK